MAPRDSTMKFRKHHEENLPSCFFLNFMVDRFVPAAVLTVLILRSMLEPPPVIPAESNHGSSPEQRAGFATTHWSVVLSARSGHIPTLDAEQALAQLCQTYWLPIYTFLRRRGSGPEDAEDLTQGFFARLLAKDYFSHADPARGRFRSFLLTSLEHFLSDARDRHDAAKRGGGLSTLRLDTRKAEQALEEQAIDTLTPERLYEQRWAYAVVETVLERLGQEFARTARAEFFAELRGYIWGEQATTPYRDIASRFGITEGAVRVTLYRLRKRFRELLRLEVAQTVSKPEEVEDEIRHLAAMLLG